MPWNIHIERRFHAFIFDLLNLANPKLREDKATKASTWYDCIILYLSMNNWQEEVYIIQAWANCVVHSKTTILICYLLDYQQVRENTNVSIILLGDKKEPTKWKTNLVQQILLPNNHFPCYFYFKNHFYWRKEKRCVTCLWQSTKANTQI